MRGVTDVTRRLVIVEQFLLTRPMRGVTEIHIRKRSTRRISTHTPHAGRDIKIRVRLNPVQFLLTRPMRGVTWRGPVKNSPEGISTHTPHAGRDYLPFAVT